MKIEFFHDAICSFCFPMSHNMRKLAEKYPDIEIVHRSFALAWEPDDMVNMFGSREGATAKIVPHWEKANQYDELGRFNTDGMLKTEFLFPISRKPLLAAKAAGMVGGEEGYWDAFDAIQNKLYVQNRNIEEDAVLEEAMKEAGIDPDAWKEAYLSDACEEKVLEDFALAERYDVRSVPTLIVDGERKIYGALNLERLEQALFEKPTLNTL